MATIKVQEHFGDNEIRHVDTCKVNYMCGNAGKQLERNLAAEVMGQL